MISGFLWSVRIQARLVLEPNSCRRARSRMRHRADV